MARQKVEEVEFDSELDELKTENIELRKKLKDVGDRSLEIEDELFRQDAGHYPAKLFLALFYALIMAQLGLSIAASHARRWHTDFFIFIDVLLLIGTGAILLEHWFMAERKRGWVALGFRCAMMAGLVHGLYEGLSYETPVRTIEIFTFLILVIQSPFPDWVAGFFDHAGEYLNFGRQKDYDEGKDSGSDPEDTQ